MENVSSNSSSNLSLVQNTTQDEIDEAEYEKAEYEEAYRWVDENPYVNLCRWIEEYYFAVLESQQDASIVYGKYADSYIQLVETCIFIMQGLTGQIQAHIRKNLKSDPFTKRKERNIFNQLTKVLEERIDLVKYLHDPIVSNRSYGDYENYSLDEALNRYREDKSEKAPDLAQSANKQNLIKCESPIEKDFVESIYREFAIGRVSIDKLQKQCNIPREKEHFWLLQQMEVQYQADEHIHPELKYRIDVAFPRFKLAVELDGHDFHSTKEARSRDTKRDRALIKHGWQVIRFTGSDIFRDIDSCVEECIEVLYSRAVQLNITN